MRRKILLTLRQLLHVDLIRVVVAWLRWTWFARIRGRLRTFKADGASPNTVAHNLKGLKDFRQGRSLVLIRPLVAALSIVPPHARIERPLFDGVRVLSIGPRTEGELLNLVAHGFDPRLVRGLDLISYSPWVDLGDLHALPYPADSWDAVVAGWVLAYSDRKQQAADEIVRVARPGALVAVGVEYSSLTNEEQLRKYGYLAGSAERIRSTAELLKYFDGHVDRVFFSHDVPEHRKHEEVVALVAVFSLRK